MNDYLKENKGVSDEKIITSLLGNLDKIKNVSLNANNYGMLTDSEKLTMCSFFSEYSSLLKTIIVRYLQNSNVSNKRLSEMSMPEIFCKFKSEIAKDTGERCNLREDLHIVAFNIRNKLSHTYSQLEYISDVIDKSKMPKIVKFLNEVVKEAKQIQELYLNKIEHLNIYESKKGREQEVYPFSIRC